MEPGSFCEPAKAADNADQSNVRFLLQWLGIERVQDSDLGCVEFTADHVGEYGGAENVTAHDIVSFKSS